MKTLFIFLDGVGLGENDPAVNPFARAATPCLRSLLGGQALVRETAPFENDFAALLALDPNLGVTGLPQSATGQAALLTGINVPAALGYHYGPKPNPAVAKYLDGATLFSKTVKAGKKAALLSAYPPRYFDGIQSGKRIHSAIPLACVNAGLRLFDQDDYKAGKALAADFTGQGWRDILRLHDAPLYAPREAGRKLAEIASAYDFSLFEYWASDYAGHQQDMESAVNQLERLDGVLQGLLENWKREEGLILLTSDHGNMEDLSTRRHTAAAAPLLIFGERNLRREFQKGVHDLTGIAPSIARILNL